MAHPKVLIGNILSFPEPEKVDSFLPGFMLINEKGKIEDLDTLPLPEKYRGIPKTDYSNHWIFPGFIDLHSHIPQLDEMGRYSSELLTWLEKYILPREARFKDPECAREASRRFFSHSIRNGTTLSVLYSSFHSDATDIAFQEAQKAGIKAIIGKVQMDQNVPPEFLEDTEISLKESIDLMEKWHGYDDNRLMYAFSPRFAPVTSRDLLRAIGRVAQRSGVYIQTHLSENRGEVELLRKLFPEFPSYTALYEAMGLLGPRTLLAHAIHLEEGEFKILKKTGSKVIHCPTANLFLRSGRMKMEKMEEYEITLGLGTDIGAGLSFSMLSVMRDMYFLNPIPPKKAFYLATRSASKVLGLEEETGVLEPGHDADIVVLDPLRIQSGVGKDVDRILSLLMFRGDEKVVKALYVRGDQLYP